MSQYDSITKDYDDHMHTQSDELIDQLLDFDKINIPNDSLVLEIGCGTGIDAENLLKKYPGFRYTGIDNSEGMLKLAEAKLEQFENVELRNMDLDSIELDSKFDFILSRYTVHYTKDLSNLLLKIASLLNDSGKFFFRDAHPLVGVFRKESKDYKKKEDVDFPVAGGSDIKVVHPTFTTEEYINAITGAGLEILKFEEKMGSSSERLGIEGFKIPTTIAFLLEKYD